MELRLVYRALRKVSDWTLDHFYSDVFVDTSQLASVDTNCPLVLVSSHHNEIIDIAALAVTIPNRRFVSYWAKSSMFRNPLARFILDSAASIPVERNPNRAEGSSKSKSDLLLQTCVALASGNAVGVFPEGTSYTQPRIMQVKEGAAWATVEYIKWAESRKGGKTVHKPLIIVPVGIVYTDKSQYRSKVVLTYGKPIQVAQYQTQLRLGDDQSKKVVKDITEQIEQCLVDLTINAPNWETLQAAKLGFEMKFGEDFDLSQYLPRMQSLVHSFTTPTTARAHLLRYRSLLHYTRLTHCQLSFVLHNGTYQPSPFRAFTTLVHVWLTTFLHPRFLLYLPALVTFSPGFITAKLAARLFSNLKEEETQAQYKAIFGGAGLGFSLAVMTSVVNRLIAKKVKMTAFQQLALPGIVFYTTAIVMTRWHDTLVDRNYRQFKRLKAAWNVFVGTLREPSTGFNFEPYVRLPPPPRNPFIPQQEQMNEAPEVLIIPPFYLIRRLLEARKDAMESLRETLSE